jgi:hypothetical protein
MSQLYDEPISARTTPGGMPAAISWRGDQMNVRHVHSVWQVAGDVRLFRIGVTAAGGRSGVAEIAGGGADWRLLRIWL